MNSTPLSSSPSLNEETVREKKAALSLVICSELCGARFFLYTSIARVQIGLMSTDQGVHILQAKKKDWSRSAANLIRRKSKICILPMPNFST